MKLLKTKLLFALGSEIDLIKKSEGYDYQGYSFLYFRLGEYNQGSVRDAAMRLVRNGSIDKIIRGNEAKFRLTALGRERLLSKIPLYSGQKKVWDRQWRIVILTEVGSESRLIKAKLNRLGYKRASRGVYLTPKRVSEATKKLFLEKSFKTKAQVIESKKLIVGDDIGLARQLWPLDQTGLSYEKFVSRAGRLLKSSRKNLVLLKQSKGGFKGVFDEYFRLLLKDPGLPKKLLPPGWQAEEAKELFLRLVVLAKTAGI